MILRIRSSSGTERIEVAETALFGDLISKVLEVLKTPGVSLSKNPSGTEILNVGPKVPLKTLQLKHGDMLYATLPAGKEEESPSEEPMVVVEDPIDIEIEKMDGWIQRERDKNVCKHGANGRCNWCMPIAPWHILEHDPWKSSRIRFIPFHAFLKKHQQGGKKYSIHVPSFKVKPCNKHPPWPEGICTECKPGACRLDAQIYRHVDHLEVESLTLVDKFIQAWRDTRKQRAGILYGKFVPDPTIPLGIRAIVAAIYEPPQKSTETEVVLDKDPHAELVDQLAQQLGLVQVGFIWTDLKLGSNGKLVNTREFGDAPLSSGELLRMAKMQNKHLSPCKFADAGVCGSKFVSVLVRANDSGEVELEAFQASDQCMALVKDGIITASNDPKFMRVKKLKKRYIPDVMFAAKDEYGNDVVRKAEPNMPLEFFIIRVGHGAPKNPAPTFKQIKFPIENRLVGQAQSKDMIRQQISSGIFYDNVSDFHLLVYLAKNLDPQYMNAIITYLKSKANESHVQQFFKELVPPSPVPVPSPKTTAVPPRNPTPVQPTPMNRHPSEKEWITQLTQMGFTATQVQEALWATSYQGIEAAIDFLSR